MGYNLEDVSYNCLETSLLWEQVPVCRESVKSSDFWRGTTGKEHSGAFSNTATSHSFGVVIEVCSLLTTETKLFNGFN